MEKNAHKETADIVVNVRMPQTLVNKLDNCQLLSNTDSRSKKIVETVKFFVDAQVCPRCHTLNAGNSVVCSVCRSNLRALDIIRSIEAVKLYIIDYERDNPLGDYEKYSFRFQFDPVKFFLLVMSAANPDDEESVEEYDELERDGFLDEDGYKEDSCHPISNEIIEEYRKKVTPEQILNNINESYLSSLIENNLDKYIKK